MPSGKGVTISVTAETDAGKRRHMEDYLDVRLAPNETLQKIPGLREQAFVGVFDGHGGKEAALYARERLWDLIQEQTKFRTTDRQQVTEAIEDAYWGLHKEMEPLRRTWKPNKLGDLSTAGTTACTVIFRQNHFYVANVGDSSVVLATVNPQAGEDGQPALLANMLSKDHKPEDPTETTRVESLGGQVKISRKGVPRVVWERKKMSDDPDKPPTVDFIPFLSVSRSLGDFWSWSERTQQFVVSPQPDVHVHPLDPSRQRFLVLASDGLWNVMSPQDVVDFVWDYETVEVESELMHQTRDVVRALIDEALYRWRKKGMFADNISVVIAFLTHEGSLPLRELPFAQPVENGAAHHSDTSGGADTAADKSCGRGVEAAPAAKPAMVHHVHKTHSGSTLYHKETLPGGAVVEEHTVITLRCRRKDKQRAKAEERKRRRLSVEMEGEAVGAPAKRQREEVVAMETSTACPPPPKKKSSGERDSGCESDSGSPVTASPVTEDTGSLVMECTFEPFTVGEEERSSGVFIEDSCPKSDPILPGPAPKADPLSPPPALTSSDCAPVV